MFSLTVYKKHYPPALNDDVWRLEKIGKDGSFHKRLNKEGIFTVEEFLRLVVKDSQKLRNVSVAFGSLVKIYVLCSNFLMLITDRRFLEVVCQTRCGMPS